jgi:MFS family permease
MFNCLIIDVFINSNYFNNMKETNNYQTIDTKDIDSVDEIKFSLDDILDRIGLTKFHYIMILIVGLSLIADGVEMYLIYILGPVLKEAFQVTDTHISAIVSSLFIGMSVGSLFSGLIVKKFERRNPLIVFLVIISTFGTICIIIDNIYWFMFCRFVIGLSIGILFSFTNALCEILPRKSRDFIMGSIYIYVKVGVVYWIIVYFIITQFYKAVDSYKLIILVSCVPMYIVTIMAIFCFRESPRILLWNNKQEAAFQQISEIAEGSSYALTDEDKAKLIQDIEEQKRHQEGHHDSTLSFIKSLFSRKLVKITLLCSALWLFNSFLIFGNSFALPLILKRQDAEIYIESEDHLQQVNNVFLYKMLVSALVPVPAELLAGYLTSHHFFARIYTILIGFAFQMLFAFLMVFDLPRVYIYSSFVTFFNVLSFNITKLYTTEVYNTCMRDSGYGFSNFIARVGAICIPFLIEFSLKQSLMGPGILLMVFAAIGIILTLCLPYETYGKKLDEAKGE